MPGTETRAPRRRRRSHHADARGRAPAAFCGPGHCGRGHCGPGSRWPGRRWLGCCLFGGWLLGGCWLGGDVAAQTAPAAPTEQAAPADGMRRFTSRNHTFHVDVPADWRQLAPGEVPRLRAAVPDLPVDVPRNEPRMFYCVGPVDRWLRGDFDGTYLYVVEQGNEWVVDETGLQQQLQQLWDAKGQSDGTRHEITATAAVEVGPDRHPAFRCLRTTTLRDGGRQRSIDVYAPTGGRQVSLSFTAAEARFERARPRFEAMIATLTFARPARGEPTLGDRMWTPLLWGGVVGVVLIILYRKSRRLPPGGPPRPAIPG